MTQSNTETIKEKITAAMKAIAHQWQSRHVAVIICAESDISAMQSVYGYNDEAGIGTVLYISGTAGMIDNLLATAWSAVNQSDININDNNLSDNGN